MAEIFASVRWSQSSVFFLTLPFVAIFSTYSLDSQLFVILKTTKVDIVSTWKVVEMYYQGENTLGSSTMDDFCNHWFFFLTGFSWFRIFEYFMPSIIDFNDIQVSEFFRIRLTTYSIGKYTDFSYPTDRV